MKVLKVESVIGHRNGQTTMDKKKGLILASIIFIGIGGNLVLLFSVLGANVLISLALATSVLLFLAVVLFLLLRPWPGKHQWRKS